jgi:hypothetical protein
VELDGDIDGNLGHGIACHSKPDAHGERKRDQLQAQIVKHIAMEEVAHGLSIRPLIHAGVIQTRLAQARIV